MKSPAAGERPLYLGQTGSRPTDLIIGAYELTICGDRGGAGREAEWCPRRWVHGGLFVPGVKPRRRGRTSAHARRPWRAPLVFSPFLASDKPARCGCLPSSALSAPGGRRRRIPQEFSITAQRLCGRVGVTTASPLNHTGARHVTAVHMSKHASGGTLRFSCAGCEDPWTLEADDYVELVVRGPDGATQWLGAHVGCLNRFLNLKVELSSESTEAGSAAANRQLLGMSVRRPIKADLTHASGPTACGGVWGGVNLGGVGASRGRSRRWCRSGRGGRRVRGGCARGTCRARAGCRPSLALGCRGS